MKNVSSFFRALKSFNIYNISRRSDRLQRGPQRVLLSPDPIPVQSLRIEVQDKFPLQVQHHVRAGLPVGTGEGYHFYFFQSSCFTLTFGEANVMRELGYLNTFRHEKKSCETLSFHDIFLFHLK